MIKFKFFSTDIKIDFSFFMFMSLIFMTNETDYIIMFFIACGLHELGHLIAMYIFNARGKSVYISGLGIKITQSRNNMISEWRSLIILFSGPLINLILYFLTKNYYPEFSELNFMLFIFNMLPFRNLDGGSIILYTGEILGKSYAFEIIMKIIAVIFAVTVIFILYYNYRFIAISVIIFYYSFCELIN